MPARKRKRKWVAAGAKSCLMPPEKDLWSCKREKKKKKEKRERRAEGGAQRRRMSASRVNARGGKKEKGRKKEVLPIGARKCSRIAPTKATTNVWDDRGHGNTLATARKEKGRKRKQGGNRLTSSPGYRKGRTASTVK